MPKKKNVHKKAEHRNEIGLFIHPTDYKDFDVIAMGSLDLLRQLVLKLNRGDERHNLIKRSKFNGIAVLFLDTSDTLKGALNIFNQYKNIVKLLP